MDDKRRTPVDKSRQSMMNLNLTYNSNSHSKYRRTLTPNTTTRSNINLDVTHLGNLATKPKIRTNLSNNFLQTVDSEIDCELAYNEYLQAAMKRLIVQKNTADHKVVLQQQLIVQKDVLYEMQKSRCTIQQNIEQLDKQNNLLEQIEVIQEHVEEINNLGSKYDLETVLMSLIENLHAQCDRVALNNIKPLKTQEDYDKLIDIIQNCNKIMEKMLHSGRNFEDVNTLAECIKNYKNLTKKLENIQLNINDLKKEAVYNLLQNMSDMFAVQGGYN